MKKKYNDIVHGERVLFQDLEPSAYWDAFEALRNEFFLGQERMSFPDIDMAGGLELYAKRPVPIPLAPDQERLLRPADNRQAQREWEAKRLKDIRSEIKTYEQS